MPVKRIPSSPQLASPGGVTEKGTDINAAGPYNVLSTDDLLHVRYTATGAITLNLPALTGGTVLNGRRIHVKDSGYNASVNNITVAVGNVADKIENGVAGASYPINVSGSCIWLVANTTTNNWEIVVGTAGGGIELLETEYLAGARGTVLIARWAPPVNAQGHNFIVDPSLYRSLRLVGKSVRKADAQAFYLQSDGGYVSAFGSHVFYGGVSEYDGSISLHPYCNGRGTFIGWIWLDGASMLVESSASTDGGTSFYRGIFTRTPAPTVSIGVLGGTTNAFEANVSTVELWGELA